MREVVLALAPHTDDVEFGCGGTLARLIEEGADVHVAAFSICEESVPEGFSRDALDKEFRASMKIFGLPERNVHVFRFKVRQFPAQRQEILEEIIRLRKCINPSLVFAPSSHDIHQDHHTIAEEAVRAFKFTKLLGYEMGWNNLTFDNTMFYRLEAQHIETKIKAIGCYATQKFRAYTEAGTIKSLATVRGMQIGVSYAEVFEVVRWVA